MVTRVDVASNRAQRKWTWLELAGRVIWTLVYPLFKWSPKTFWWWRRILLRSFGAHIGRNVHIYPSVKITIPWNLIIADDVAIGDGVRLYALGRITLDSRVTVSQGAHLCAGSHDLSQPSRPLTKPPIWIQSDVWIAADAFIGPGVVVEHGAVVGARAVVTSRVSMETIVIGNPARVIDTMEARAGG